jgi:hypothetical protein
VAARHEQIYRQKLGEAERDFRDKLEESEATSRDKLDELGRSLKQLRAHIVRIRQSEYEFVRWRDELHIGPNGDIRRSYEVTLRVTGEDPLHFLELGASGEPLTVEEQTAFQVSVRMKEGGGRLFTQLEWMSPQEARVWIYLHTPLKKEEVTTLVFQFEWLRDAKNSSLLFTQPTSTHGLVHRAGPYDEALHKEVERLEVVSAPESRDASVDADGGDCSERRRYEAPGQGAVRL